MPFFNSSAIKRAEYDAGSQRLQIWFPNDGPYDYCCVYNDFIRDKYDC